MDTPTPEQRTEAQAALAGADWTAKREQQAKARATSAEGASLQKKLAEITAQKETLELSWIELDNQRRDNRTKLNPLLDEEKKIEVEETAAEQEEAKIGLAADKQVAEKKRWEIQERRRAVEEKKWTEEEKAAKIETLIQKQTATYRGLLDEEEQVEKRLEQIRLEETKLTNNGQ